MRLKDRVVKMMTSLFVLDLDDLKIQVTAGPALDLRVDFRFMSGRSQRVANALFRLRAQIGDPLFHRATEGLRPTAAADALAPPARAALALLEDALAELTAADRRALRPGVLGS